MCWRCIAITGTVSGAAVAADYNITSVAAGADESFGSFWMLASTAASSTFDLTFQAEGEAEATVVEKIPYQSNRRTNIKGHYIQQ